MAKKGKPFDPTMREHHPAVQCVVGITQSGKSTYIIGILDKWRRFGGHSLAIDGACPDPPEPKHIARWASVWTPEPPETLPPLVTLVVCDETQKFLTNSKKDFPIFRECVFRGQHIRPHGVSCVLGAQRPMNIVPDAWSQAQRWVIFLTTHYDDLERIRHLPHMGTAIGKIALQMIPRLPTGYAVVVDQRDGIILPVVKEWAK